MTVVIAVGGTVEGVLKICMLFWDGDVWVKYLIYAMTTGYIYRENLDPHCFGLLNL